MGGPHAFWTGREQEWQLVDHDEDDATPEVKKLIDVGTERGTPYAFDCLLFKVKAVQDTKDDVRHPQKWLKKKLKILESFRREITDMKQFKVAKRHKKVDEE